MNEALELPYTLFQRPGTTKWWIRFSITGEGQVRKSLGVTDQEQAKRKAHEIWFEAHYRSKNGLKPQPTTFTKAAEEFIELIERDVQRGDRPAHHKRDIPPVVRRYFIEFFGKKDIDAIAQRDIAKYLEWRKDYWINGPGKDITEIRYIRAGRSVRRPLGEKKAPTNSRQRGELVILRQLFKQAVKWGYLNAAQVPVIEVPRARTPNNRPSFSPAEFSKLQKLLHGRMTNPTIRQRHRWDRTVLYAQIMLAAYSGMRPTEMKNLNWGDVLNYRVNRKKPLGERADITIRVRGKGKSREFVPLEAAVSALDLLWNFWVFHRRSDPKDSDPVLATREGKRFGASTTGFGEVMELAGLTRDYRGVKRTMYSFRHFYISQQLAYGVDVFILARNTGTSSDMIDKYYGQVTSDRMKDHLRPAWGES